MLSAFFRDGGQKRVPIIGGRDAVFLSKGAVKAGIVLKTELRAAPGEIRAGAHRVAARVQPLLCDVLVQRQPGVFLEEMGNVVFIQKEFPAERVKTQVLVEMTGDILGDGLIA